MDILLTIIGVILAIGLAGVVILTRWIQPHLKAPIHSALDYEWNEAILAASEQCPQESKQRVLKLLRQ